MDEKILGYYAQGMSTEIVQAFDEGTGQKSHPRLSRVTNAVSTK